VVRRNEGNRCGGEKETLLPCERCWKSVYEKNIGKRTNAQTHKTYYSARCSTFLFEARRRRGGGEDVGVVAE
jgi:hypothetical protein